MNRLQARLWTLTVVFILTLIASPSLATDVRLSDPVYPFLERADVLGYLYKPLPGSKPYTRVDVAQHLIAIIDHRDQLSRVDRDQLEYFRYQFRDELRYLGESTDPDYRSFWEKWEGRPEWLFPNGYDMLYFEGDDSDWTIAMNPTVKGEYYDRLPAAVGDEVISTRVVANGGVLRFRSGPWSAFGAVADNHIVMDPAIVDSVRYPYDVSGPTGHSPELLDFYDTEAEVAYQSEHVLVHLGKGRQRWGDGNTGGLLINDYSLPYTHFRFVGNWGPFRYTNVQARLQTEPRIVQDFYRVEGIGGTRNLYAQKWYSAQRFEFNVHRNFRFAFFEQVIYGERGFDVEYLNPLIFIQGQEHYTGDPDNMMLGGDFRWLAFNRAIFHLQILFDEFVFADLGSDDYSNKWAYLAGVKWMDAFNVRNSQLFVEYVRIRPYVYSHKFQINRATHLSANLGYGIPPNSDNFVVGWRQQVARGAAVTVHVRGYRHGANPEGIVIGGDVYHSDHDNLAVRDSVPFLTGDKETQREVGLAVELEPIQHLQTTFNVRYVDRELLPEEGAGVKESDVLFQAVVRWFPTF